MSKKKQPESSPSVRPSDRAPGKFDAVYADGTVHPYAFRTEAEAWAVLPKLAEEQGDDAGE